MLKQKPMHVKMLANRSGKRREWPSQMRGGPSLFDMVHQIKFVVLIAPLLLGSALSWAQSPDLDALRRKAEAGDPKAQFDLAEAYSEGNGVAKDFPQGMEWLKKSATQGYAGAQVVLGIIFQQGINTEKDPSEAAKWFRKAAKQADKDPKHAQTAQNHLSDMLAQGLISAQEADWHHAESPATTAATTPKTSKPNQSPRFSFSEVETGLTGGITNKRMATLVSTYGVDFTLSPNAKSRLTHDGADDSLLQTIASSKR
jgi:hypothetical protein